jgi:rSAM/selenodomain-associated transferase 1
MSHARTHLGVFAKFWQPGLVKTRLAVEIGAERAAALYRIFVETTLQRLDGLAQRQECCVWPPDRETEFCCVLPPGWVLTAQVEGDLGRRIKDFFDRAFALGSRSVILVGTDTPSLPTIAIEHAFNALERVSVVLGPSRDGGYYLVGARDATPPIFEQIAWSTPAVWDQTVAALERSGLRQGRGFEVTALFSDVDTLADMRELRLRLGVNPIGESFTRLANAIDTILAGVP